MKATFCVLCATLLAALSFLGCAWGFRPYSKTEIPVDFSKAGAVYETDFQIYRKQHYDLVAMWYTDHFNHSNEVFKYLKGIFTDNGRRRIGIPVHILITRVFPSGEEVIVEKNDFIFDFFAVGGKGDPVYSAVTSFDLKPGKYRMRITNLKEHRRLKFVPVKIKLLRLYA